MVANHSHEVWGPYPNYDDVARFEYGRMFWRNPLLRKRLLAHWCDERHPYWHRFQEQRSLIEEVLEPQASPAELDLSLRDRGTSLRGVTREIPPLFGHFWNESSGDPFERTK